MGSIGSLIVILNLDLIPTRSTLLPENPWLTSRNHEAHKCCRRGVLTRICNCSICGSFRRQWRGSPHNSIWYLNLSQFVLKGFYCAEHCVVVRYELGRMFLLQVFQLR